MSGLVSDAARMGAALPASRLDAALAYLAHGYSVIPVRKEDKKSLVQWKKFQTRLPTEVEIRQWWSKWPEANIAIITGGISGIVGVDVDGERGRKKLNELLRVHGALPVTVKSVSGRMDGGEHIFFKHPGKPVPTVANNGLDIRGDGGYIVVAPSVHASGTMPLKNYWPTCGRGIAGCANVRGITPLEPRNSAISCVKRVSALKPETVTVPTSKA